MKDNHNDYSSFLAFICGLLLSMSMYQCMQTEALEGIKNELEILNIKQK